MKFTVVLILLLSSFDLIAQKDIKLTSPSKQLSFSFHNGREGLFYNISFKNKRIINNSSISLDFIDGKFKQNLKAGKPVFRKGVEDYELIVGKARFVHDPYLEVLIPLEEQKPLSESSILSFVHLMMELHSDMNFPSSQAGLNFL